jgi:hypothetical protein
MPLRKKLQKIAEKFFGIPPPTSSASCFICNKLKYPHYGIDFFVQETTLRVGGGSGEEATSLARSAPCVIRKSYI